MNPPPAQPPEPLLESLRKVAATPAELEALRASLLRPHWTVRETPQSQSVDLTKP